jgi:predicted O-methyltransferase YrrM
MRDGSLRALPGRSTASVVDGASVPSFARSTRGPSILSSAAHKAIRQRMLLLRHAAADRIVALTGIPASHVRGLLHELSESPLPDQLIGRGAGLPFAQEMPQGALLYLIVRGQRPDHVIETGVRPGYSTAWLLAALEANGHGELTSIGPGPTAGRSAGVHDVSVGQFVPPALRARWTLVLGNTMETVTRTVGGRSDVDLFLYDNGPDLQRARFELRSAWAALSPRGILLAHHVDANTAWAEFARAQGASGSSQLDPGPPPMGALTVRAPAARV